MGTGAKNRRLQTAGWLCTGHLQPGSQAGTAMFQGAALELLRCRGSEQGTQRCAKGALAELASSRQPVRGPGFCPGVGGFLASPCPSCFCVLSLSLFPQWFRFLPVLNSSSISFFYSIQAGFYHQCGPSSLSSLVLEALMNFSSKQYMKSSVA